MRNFVSHDGWLRRWLASPMVGFADGWHRRCRSLVDRRWF